MARGISRCILRRKPSKSRSALESWSWLGNKRELPLRRAGGASRHSVLAIRARKQSLAARLGDSFYFAKSEIVESLLRRGGQESLSHADRLIPAGANVNRLQHHKAVFADDLDAVDGE